jgi:hypothetical protein
LSDPEFAIAREQLKAQILADPAVGLALLQGAGIVNAKGKLKRSFGG